MNTSGAGETGGAPRGRGTATWAPRRARRLVVAGTATLTVLVAAGAVAAHAAPTPAAAAAGASVLSATELAPLVQNSHVDTVHGGRDNGQSAGYGGSSVWFFNDTFERDPAGFPSNTAAITSDLNAADGITLTSATPYRTDDTGVPPEIVPRTLAEFSFQLTHNQSGCTTASDRYCGSQYAYWPGPVVADPARHRVLVFFGKLCRGQSGSADPCYNDFVGHAIGTGVAALDMDAHAMSRLTATNVPAPVHSIEGDDPTMLFDPDHSYGSTSVVLDGETLYAYGECGGLSTCKVGRVPVASVTDRSKWTFYTGNDAAGNPTWGTDMAVAARVMNTGAAGGTVSWSPGLNAYLNVYMAAFSNDAMFQTAPHPWGPWSTPTKMFTGVAATSGNDYAMYSHAEYAERNGLVQYVTYYHPTDGVQHLVKVTFSG